MSYTPDDKSAQEACYMTEDGHDPCVSYDHTNLSDPILEPEQHHEAKAATSNTYFRVIGRTAEHTQRPASKLAHLGMDRHEPIHDNRSASKLAHLGLSRIPPRRVALCGGGVRGVAHVGVMKAIRDAGFLSHVREVLGVSAGSLFALLWVLEYTVEQIEKLSIHFDFNLLRSIDLDSVLEFPTRYGLDEGAGLERLISSILKQKGLSADVTFAQMAVKYPLRLRCFATELETCRVRQFGSLQTPNVSVKFAIRASMALPIFYTPVKDPETGYLLVDGGLLNNLPLVFMTEKEMIDTICVFFARKQEENHIPVKDMMDMFNCMYDSATILKSKPYIEKYRDNVIVIQMSDFGVMNFSESKEHRETLITLAYEKANEFLFTPRCRIRRRFSAS